MWVKVKDALRRATREVENGNTITDRNLSYRRPGKARLEKRPLVIYSPKTPTSIVGHVSQSSKGQQSSAFQRWVQGKDVLDSLAQYTNINFVCC